MVNRMSPPLSSSAASDIGGAVCRRLIMRGGEIWKRPNEILSEADVRTIAPANLTAMRDSGYLQTFPKNPGQGGTRFAIHRGCGKYDVIEGVQINTEQLSKEDAEALCADGSQH